MPSKTKRLTAKASRIRRRAASFLRTQHRHGPPGRRRLLAAAAAAAGTDPFAHLWRPISRAAGHELLLGQRGAAQPGTTAPKGSTTRRPNSSLAASRPSFQLRTPRRKLMKLISTGQPRRDVWQPCGDMSHDATKAWYNERPLQNAPQLPRDATTRLGMSHARRKGLAVVPCGGGEYRLPCTATPELSRLLATPQNSLCI